MDGKEKAPLYALALLKLYKECIISCS